MKKKLDDDNNNPSKFYIIKIIIRLLPNIINFRRDRREWVKKEGRNINEVKYRKHANQLLNTFISLGPSYIKLGQWLSSRADILPQPYLEVLSTLQDDVPVSEFYDIKTTIEKEIGNIEDVFNNFNTKAISGASLGQVYLAEYKNKQVTVKVARPNIEKIVEMDIKVLKKLIPFATRFIDPNLKFSINGMFAQFIETIYEEMDYKKEAENLLTIKKNLKDDPRIIIPNIILERSSKHVLTTEYISGIKITDIKKLEENNIDREKLIVRIHYVFFKMLLRNNIFHADPHPGNLRVKEDGSLILYDFGMVGRMDNETRIRLIRLYLGLIQKDPIKTVDILIDLGTLEANTNRNLVEKALELSIRSLHGKQVDKMEVKALMELSNKTLSKFPFRLPKNLALYMRMASILEGIYHYHKIKFHFVKVLSDLLEQEGLIKEAYLEEASQTIKKIWKNIGNNNQTDLLNKFIDNQNENDRKKIKYYKLIAGSIFAGALFIGSTLIFSTNSIIAYVGIFLSFIIFFIMNVKK